MENKESKGRNFGFTQLRGTEEKINDSEKPQVREIIEGEDKKSPSIAAAERLKIMQQHRLKIDTVDVGGPVEYSEYEKLDAIVKALKREARYKGERFRYSIKMQAAKYIVEGIERDYKKIIK